MVLGHKRSGPLCVDILVGLTSELKTSRNWAFYMINDFGWIRSFNFDSKLDRLEFNAGKWQTFFLKITYTQKSHSYLLFVCWFFYGPRSLIRTCITFWLMYSSQSQNLNLLLFYFLFDNFFLFVSFKILKQKKLYALDLLYDDNGSP